MIERSTLSDYPRGSSLPKETITKPSISPINTERHGERTTPPPSKQQSKRLGHTRGSYANVRPPAPPKFSENPFPVTPGIEGFSANIRDMYSTRGARAFIQGFSPTLVRQVSNSVVRFTTYNLLKQVVHPKDSESINPTLSFGLGVVAGGVEVLATQPIDVVKTRMQTINGIPKYRSMLFGTYRVMVEEGPLALWSGLVPRFIRVTFSGGIIFTVYELTNTVVSKAVQENPFSWA